MAGECTGAAAGHYNPSVADAIAELKRGRGLYVSEAWSDAYEALAAADRLDPLGADDLELLATSAYMIGHEEDYLGLLERAHRAHLAPLAPGSVAGEPGGVARAGMGPGGQAWSLVGVTVSSG